jgi:hypothetical protein
MSTGLPSRTEINNINNLDYSRPYQDFDYSKYINEIKLSNFAHTSGGGGNKGKKQSQKSNNKRINRVMKHLYIDYMHGKGSYISGGSVSDLPISISDTYNVVNLNYKACFNPPRVRHISSVPYSSFQI